MPVTVNQYLALIPSANASKSKFRALVAAKCQPWVDLQNLLLSIPDNFDLDQATGTQLDIVGLWVGISRLVKIPIEVYFSFNTENLGLNQGVIYLPFQPTYGVTALDDGTYRLLLKAKIAANHWDGTTPSLVSILQSIFSPATVSVTDNLDMSISVAVSGTPPSVLFKNIAENGYLPIKPAGISISYSFS
jgi:hypothetical protein